MSKKFHPKDKFLQDLVMWFEESIKEETETFFPEEELEQLIDYYESLPNYDKAFLAVKRAIELFPYSSNFYLKLAQLHYHAKNFAAAWDAIDEARVYEQQSVEMLLLEADLLTAENEYDEAIEKLDMLLELVSRDERADVLLEMADVYEVSDRKNNLGNVLQHILLNYPSNEEALHRYWNFVIDYDDFEKGIHFFTQSIDKRPYNFLAWYYLAKCFEEVGLYEKAIDAYEYTIAINAYYFAHWDYGLCLQTLERWDDAIANYEEMISLFDEEAAITTELALCKKHTGDLQAALILFQEAKQITNDSLKKAECDYYIGTLFQDEGNIRKAIYYYRSAVNCRENKPRFLNALGRAYWLNEQFELATDCFIKSLAIKDTQAKQWMRLAACYHIMGMPDLLIDALQKAVAIMPQHPKLHYTFAAYLLNYGFNQSGLTLLTQALELDSSKKETIFGLFPELQIRVDVMQLFDQH